jgi:dodecin
MSIAKVIEITARSEKSFDDAVRVGVERASKTVDNIQSAWVKEFHAEVTNGKVTAFRVNLKLTFVLSE